MSDGTMRRQDAARGRRRSTGALSGIAVRLGLGAVALCFGAPFLWIVAAAFDGAAGSYVPWPSAPTLDNFTGLFRDGFGGVLRDSVVVAGGSAIVTALAAALAGYALSRLNWRGAGGLAAGLLLLQTMPLVTTMIPIFDLTRRLGLRNSYLGLVLVHAALALPLLIWLMKAFFDALPVALEEAAWIDGASRLRAWREVLLPLARPGLALAVGLAFLVAWSEALLAMVLSDAGRGPETVALAFYRAAQETGSFSTEPYEPIAAMGVLYVVPVLLLFLLVGRFAGGGLTGSLHGE